MVLESFEKILMVDAISRGSNLIDLEMGPKVIPMSGHSNSKVANQRCRIEEKLTSWNGTCKGPEVRRSLTCSQGRKKVGVARRG